MRHNRPEIATRIATRFAAWALVAAASVTGMHADEQEETLARQRSTMVEEQIVKRGVTDERVLDAMREVPRHLFIPEAYRDAAYFDAPQPIGSRQTISQPYIVALMSSLLELDGDERVLEIGTGSGYQAAILSRLAEKVYSIEIRKSLADLARSTLEEIGYDNIEVRVGDGYGGWPEAAPFDGIIVTAAPEKVPQALIDQLEVGAKMVIPVGNFFQDLLVVTKTEDGVHTKHVAAVRFVPMVTDPEDGR